MTIDTLGIISIPIIPHDTSREMASAHLSKHSFHSPDSVKLTFTTTASNPTALSETPLSLQRNRGSGSRACSGSFGMRVQLLPPEQSSCAANAAYANRLVAQIVRDACTDRKTHQDFHNDFQNCTLGQIFKNELIYLVNYDRAKKELQNIVDMPDRLIDLFITLTTYNDGKLSAGKRVAHFSMLTDDEIVQMERVVQKTMGDDSVS